MARGKSTARKGKGTGTPRVPDLLSVPPEVWQQAGSADVRMLAQQLLTLQSESRQADLAQTGNGQANNDKMTVAGPNGPVEGQLTYAAFRAAKKRQQVALVTKFPKVTIGIREVLKQVAAGE